MAWPWKASTSVRFLGALGQYVLGPGTADGRIIPPGRSAYVSRAAGWIAPVVVGARIVGTWETRATTTLEITLFKEAMQPQPAALEAEAGRITALLRKPLTLCLRSE